MAPIASPSTLHSWSGEFRQALKTIHSRGTMMPSDPISSWRTATRTVSSFVTKRQDMIAIPTTYIGLNAGPDSGTVVGIVLGSVGGLLLLLWLIYTCFNLGGRPAAVGVEDVEVVRRRSRSPRRSRRSETRSEVIEVSRRSRTPPPQRSRRETIIVEETRRPERREDVIVEVIEEHSPPPPRRSRRASGYRNVNPGEFAGGRDELRHVRH